MSVGKQLTWDNFRSTVLVRGQQRVHRIANSPSIEVFGDGVLNRIGIWLELSAGSEPQEALVRLSAVHAERVEREGRGFLQITTDTPALHRQFYHFAMAVAERVITEKLSAYEAAALELQCFSDLLQEAPLLGVERQIGLLGELLFLERLLANHGINAIESWVGPAGEPHDFRIGGSEFEVKTTLSSRRIHTIHGAEQLVASTGCNLYLASLQLGPPGTSGGFSLSSKVGELRQHFAPSASKSQQFINALESYGLRQPDEGHYGRRYVWRKKLALAAVDNAFPAITTVTIRSALGSLAPRVGAVHYDVNIEGLELEEGTVGFNAVLGSS